MEALHARGDSLGVPLALSCSVSRKPLPTAPHELGALTDAVGALVAEQSSDARIVLGWLHALGPMDARNLALACAMPVSLVLMHCRRLVAAGLVVRLRSGAWQLSGSAATWAPDADTYKRNHCHRKEHHEHADDPLS